MDHIKVYVSCNDAIQKVAADNADKISKVVLADEILSGKEGGAAKEWNINGEKVTLGVEKV